jgi:hypothetical protein
MIFKIAILLFAFSYLLHVHHRLSFKFLDARVHRLGNLLSERSLCPKSIVHKKINLQTLCLVVAKA